MDQPNECVLHSPRLAIFHSPTFDDTEFLISLLGSLRQTSRHDWEIAVPKYQVHAWGVLEQELYQHHQLMAGFVIPRGDDQKRFRVYQEMADYVTHVIILRDVRDHPMERLLSYCRDIGNKIRIINVWDNNPIGDTHDTA